MAEKQYQKSIKAVLKKGSDQLGLMTTWAYHDDPKRLAFTFARYKFVAKMLSGLNDVLEVGCGDGFISRVVAQTVSNLTAIDFDKSFIDDANSRSTGKTEIRFIHHDILKGSLKGKYDGIYTLDVMEHIEKADEEKFIKNIIKSLKVNGVLIVGMPSLQSQKYASPQSKAGHVNCKDQSELKAVMGAYFHNVFIFSMNDEVVHTGFGQMSNYNIALCCGKKR